MSKSEDPHESSRTDRELPHNDRETPAELVTEEGPSLQTKSTEGLMIGGDEKLPPQHGEDPPEGPTEP